MKLVKIFSLCLLRLLRSNKLDMIQKSIDKTESYTQPLIKSIVYLSMNLTSSNSSS